MNASHAELPESARSKKAIKTLSNDLSVELKEHGLNLGSAIYIRIFKQSSELELWVQKSSGDYKLFKVFPICTFSGDLGPKLSEGDGQSPEGFYYVTPKRMNPWSQFHLSFNLGFPNAYDRYHNRTGSALMVHGNCVSIGCYAMTDPLIEEIYTVADSALRAGQPFFRVHIFPFRMTEQKLSQYKNHHWYAFWRNLQQGYELFEHHQIPPNVEIVAGQYVFNY